MLKRRLDACQEEKNKDLLNTRTIIIYRECFKYSIVGMEPGSRTRHETIAACPGGSVGHSLQQMSPKR
jgi:hypothetical protein